MKSKKSRWRTVRCVIEYRTPSEMSDRDFATRVQYLLDTMGTSELRDSKMWAKSFSGVLSRMDAARPRRLRAAIRALEAVAARLRKL